MTEVTLASGTLTARIADAGRWSEVLLALFDAITAAFVPPRPAPPDHQLDRARRELGELRPDDPRQLARIIDATTSPDAAMRRIAFERLEGADSPAALRPWAQGLEDSSRAVRRATAAGLAYTRRPDTRDLLEHALADADASVRYYAVRGLAGIDGANSAARRRAPAPRSRRARAARGRRRGRRPHPAVAGSSRAASPSSKLFWSST